MKHTITATLLCCAALSACDSNDSSLNTSSEVKREWVEFTQALTEYTKEESTKATEMMRQKLDSLDSEIKALKNEAESLTDTALEQHKEAIAALQEQKQQLQGWYSKLKDNSGEAWIETKKGLENAYQKLVN